jgi:hypothetical protein
MTVMATMLGTLFVGVSILAHRLEPYPTHDETVISQMGRAVYGGGPLYVILQFSTAAILTLAANTAYADFPRLSSIIARDGYLPRQLANRGDRLVYSNGIVFLAAASALLIVGFGGVTNALIPLYAVGVFTSFTLSQTGMVKHHLRDRAPRWQRGLAINAVGAVVTFIVLLIVAITKFAVGAWLPIVVIPCVIVLFRAIRRHYDRVAAALRSDPTIPVETTSVDNTVIVLVGGVHNGVRAAVAYASSLRPARLLALSVAYEEEDAERLRRQWAAHGIEIPLEIVASPYRDLQRPIIEFIGEIEKRYPGDLVTVVIPEFVVGRWYEHILHNQSALFLKGRLLFREGTVVTSVPYHLSTLERKARRRAEQAERLAQGERAEVPDGPGAPVSVAPRAGGPAG